QYPQTYVENCADAIVLACENRAADGQTLNVIDDEVPSQRQMVAMLRRRASPKPFVLPVNYSLLRFIAWSAWTFNGVFLKRRAKIPGLFVPARLHARLKPLKYTNKRVKDVLGWTPKYSIEQGIDRSLAAAGVSTSSDVQLRIAYMTGQYPRATDTFIQREVAALRERGVHVETLSVRRPGDKENVGPETQAERGRTTYLLPFRPLPLLKAHASALAASPKRYLKALKTALFVRPPGVKSLVWQLAYFAEAALVCAKVREQRLVHLHNHFSNSSCTVAMLAAEMGGFTFSFTMHGPNEFFEPDYWRLDEKLRRALFANCISHFCRSQGMIFSPAAKWERLHIVHCGVDPTAFSLVRHDGRGRNLLYVGRLADVKGLPVLIDAFAALRKDRPELTLTLAGDGPDRLELESRARDLGVTGSVRFLGYQSQAQVRALLQSTDVFVMASFAEGVPVVLMEAMAAGVPVVATRIAGIPELVEPGISGFLVPPGDPQTLAVRIGELLDDSALRSRFGAAGRAKVEREYDVRAEAGWLCEVLTEALAGRVAPVRRDGMTGLATPEKLPQVVASSS
ncbi:MAG TPA: glycosyltransferase, partial [Tepidisphaeraceae bacterium]|nr:glycosyltransferase [Tepidisphaeraceae bacterium]